jgi:hypothetical protein
VRWKALSDAEVGLARKLVKPAPAVTGLAVVIGYSRLRLRVTDGSLPEYLVCEVGARSRSGAIATGPMALSRRHASRTLLTDAI